MEPYYNLLKLALRSLLAAAVRLRDATFKFFTAVADTLFSLYFASCSMLPCTVDLDADSSSAATTVHFWIPGHRKSTRPALVLIHGFGANSRWQFYYQVRHLSKHFNLYVPDLLFFGRSYSENPDRSIEFQAGCVAAGLRKLGLERYSVVGLSYGGYVAYRMAEVDVAAVEKVVIISSGIHYTEEQKEEQMRRIGGEGIRDLLLPKKPGDVRKMIKLALYKSRRYNLAPDFVLQGFIGISNNHKKEKLELVDHLMKKANAKPARITQETLLLWGEKDNVFPLHFAYQLQSYLGATARVEVLKDTGHGANIDSPDEVNRLITWFVSSAKS
ncbi:unnamed protein product [Linum tenue]|uniref:AB hydrolase-1 domain-containing protein n=1 Tax=Linum tenue TaxID=586396 RepID=A0AAV0PKC9_9ROSI|nr:unnamed protein product [Linum tenue]